MRYHDAEIIALVLRLKKEVVSTGELGQMLGISQQSVSRKLRDIESKGLVKRELCRDGQRIIVLDKGFSLVRTALNELSEAVSISKKPVKFRGFVVSGSGEGAYYLGLDEYFVQLRDKLGFLPFKGTLNLEIMDEHNLGKKEEFTGSVPIIINGFSDSGRSFGDIMCFRCRIGGTEGALLVPKRTHHDERIVEIMAPVNLREAMNLGDGDEVEVTSH